ncbi:DUF4259 domain-containing protein [Nonomuraea zeae]|uniref:DUF4259 domain-containing protein n=1 Tax=Nonomuraea zeae TaxID=1642303 RepID=A0A5S4GEL5_9ACTN|nr:DUF4259 domain-containing protein [Nonomuraea zeae]TMR30934.1 DUF4259 domain-containing protein [Nonomuraea zeae]
MDSRTPFEGPFDSDEAADAVADLEAEDDVAAAMTQELTAFLQHNRDYVEEGAGESALAICCLVAARISGIAPDEAAHHWLDRNPFTVDGELRDLAVAAFALATRPRENFLAECYGPGPWEVFTAYLEPYRLALHGEPQELPEPFVPDHTDPRRAWLQVCWSTDRGSLPHDCAYQRRSDQLVQAVNDSRLWRAWWQSSGLQEAMLFGHLGPGSYTEQTSRGRTTAEAWFGFEHTHDLGAATPGQVVADLRTGLSRLADHLRLDPLPGFGESTP